MYEFAVGQVKAGTRRRTGDALRLRDEIPEPQTDPERPLLEGEAFYAEKDYENAILTFQDVVDKYPGEKAPDAMYKQGLSFLALNDKKNAGSCSISSRRSTEVEGGRDGEEEAQGDPVGAPVARSGIESSCDETAAAVYDVSAGCSPASCRPVAVHGAFGGVVRSSPPANI